MAYRITADCVECGSCKEQCPNDAISMGSPYKINPDLCIECGACESVCPQRAIKQE